MNSKQKAEELILKFREVPIEDSLLWHVGYEISKEFALIAVKEISENCYEVMKPFWQEVKNEIEKL
jgi:hypothetical protein